MSVNSETLNTMTYEAAPAEQSDQVSPSPHAAANHTTAVPLYRDPSDVRTILSSGRRHRFGFLVLISRVLIYKARVTRRWYRGSPRMRRRGLDERQEFVPGGVTVTRDRPSDGRSGPPPTLSPPTLQDRPCGRTRYLERALKMMVPASASADEAIRLSWKSTP